MKYQCRDCVYAYYPERGDPANGIPPKTKFEELPENWLCPVCGARKARFKII
ncbi:rubredoxin [Prochlorococcus sp. MIT 1307]|uniref:rubredoxin n=1 Tax=Prochlorococcus sp. MIT 1307 TaxID=3096219 RepID=UPI002A7623CE|nr:rubredoxin [Prochlorococcus sp. MIT 1307]